MNYRQAHQLEADTVAAESALRRSRARRRIAIAKFIVGSLASVAIGTGLGVAVVWGAAQEFDRRCSTGQDRGAEHCPPHRAEGRWGRDGKWNWQRTAENDNA